jgi:hypothetical protein
MRPPHPLRSLARVLPLLVLWLAVPHVTLGQPATPGAQELVPEARVRLAQAAEDSRLAPWQRDLMQRLARTGTTTALDSSAAERGDALPARASDDVDGAWSQPLGPTLTGHSAIYDQLYHRMVVFGGYGSGSTYFNDVWELSLEGTPAWTQLTPWGTTKPSARHYHSAIYDPVRYRMVVFGGTYDDGSSHVLNDVWALSLLGTPAWTRLTPSGTPPSARSTHSAIYDPVRDRMVVFGGGSSLKDVWALSLAGTPAWTQLAPSGAPPIGRSWHSAIYDPVRDRMVVFGGYYYDGSSHALNDVWALSLAGTPAWTQLTPSGTPPIGRLRHSAIYDPVRDRMVVFGGGSNSYPNYFLNDVWALSLAGTPAWTELIPSGTPPIGRTEPSAIYDPVRDRMVVFGGGSDSYPGYYLNDVWALSQAGTPAWTELTPSGTLPPTRSGHSAIYDPVRKRMVVFGGYENPGPHLNDVWALSLGGTPPWTQLAPSGTPPSAREGHTAIYDPVRDRMVFFGGFYDDDGSYYYLNDVWALSLAGTPAWTQLTPSGTPPIGRSNHSAIYDPVRDRIVVFGGYSYDGSEHYLNDVWALSLAGTPAWTPLTPSGTPPSGRYAPSAIYDPVRDRMVVFGGSRYDGLYSMLNDVWALSLADPTEWTELTPWGTPPIGRERPSAIHDPVRDRMVVFGGYDELNDVWALSLADPTEWTELTPWGTRPPGRAGLSAIYDPVRECMVVFGGEWYGGLNDVWALTWWRWPYNEVEDPLPPLISGLRPPAPNPTRGTTAVNYALAQAGHVQLGVYDVSGRLVRRLVDGEQRAGTETTVWNGTDESGAKLGAGVYFVRLAGPGIRETRRVILLE